VHVLSLPAHHVVVVANDLWYTRAAHGLTAAAPERAPLKGSWVDIHEEASRRLLGVGRARPTGFWANWPVFGQSATSILPTDRPAFEQPTARPTPNRTSRGLAPPAFGFRLGWAHDTFPHSALACILYLVSYFQSSCIQLRAIVSFGFGAGLALGPSLAGLGCVLLPHGPGSERGGGSLSNWKERRGVRPKGRWINIWRCICKGKAKPSRLPTKLERGRGTRPAN
jgi:hypothetical protein